ncbi:MAG: FprA family A-type flavoprotein [Chloroflexi bacterium]|nr:FprA family A-type flavoprotein [Chloroflexota bacterium]
MKAKSIRPGVFWVGAEDWDRRFFDNFIPLPDGTCYNSYLVQGSDKTVLIDAVDPAMQPVLMARLDDLSTKKVDYIVANHAEQDHSGSIPALLARYPEAKVVCTPRCKGFLIDLHPITEDRIITVADREVLSLGDKTLEFIHAPWVHWPETMFTYLREEKILFSCDLFGSHLATSELYVTDEAIVYEAAKRYYAEIMMPFRTNIEKHLERLQEYPLEIIASSHGPLYPKPEFILGVYRKWVSDPPENIVVLPYVSMHGSTRQMVGYFVEALSERGITVKQFDLTTVDVGKLAMALVDAATLVIGAPTVLVGPHPLVAYTAFLTNSLRPKLRFAAVIGSYGWGSQAVDRIVSMLPNLKVEYQEPVLVRGAPKEADFRNLEVLADKIAEKHKGLSVA